MQFLIFLHAGALEMHFFSKFLVFFLFLLQIMVNFESKRSCMPLVLVVIFSCKLKLIQPPFILDILLY